MRNALLSICVVALTAGAAFAVVAPKDGGPLPMAMRERMAKDPTMFKLTHAWIQKAERAKAARAAYLASLREAGGPSAVAGATLSPEMRVAGTVAVPVFAGYFTNRAQPYPIASLSNKLFDNPSGTITDYYDEVSYGALNMTGTVYGWTPVSQIDSYYEGVSNGTDPSTDRTGEFMEELLDTFDGSVDFGQYDNDGPDGVPNSGDDDGFVDLVAFVHCEAGGECSGGSTGNIWSHQWSYSQWPNAGGLPYQTNDARNGGGVIQIQDYVIQPAVNCPPASTTVPIEIGVFCHEFGHGLGLPDLYDTWPYDGTSGNGIGHWGIMGSGNWNTPSSPAHPCAWTREEMGWIVPTEVDWTNQVLNIPNVNQTGTVFRLPFSDDRFRRSNACTITGTYSLYCGLTVTEGTARGWASPGPNGGYGALWDETVAHDFYWDGTAGPVTFTYKYDYDIEAGYDYAYSAIEVNGTETILAVYTGSGAGTQNINIAPYLTPLGAGGNYTLKFRVLSDYAFSDDDGFYTSTCGALIVDDVAVTGGGVAYSTGFETFLDGWYQDPGDNPAREYWMVENRQAVGFDANLHNTGLLIWHVDQEVMHAPYFGNDIPGGAVGGVVLEEADGDADLNYGTPNRGEAGDSYPGSTNNTTFSGGSTPNSDDNADRPTRIQLTNISASAMTMTAQMRAGDPAPTASGIVPNNIDNDLTAVDVAISGGFIRHGATFRLEYPGAQAAAPQNPQDALDIVPFALEWIDYARLQGTINVYSKQAGLWDLVVTNPDGQEVRLVGAVTINYIVAVQLVSAALDVVEGGVRVAYVLRDQEPGEIIRLYRSLTPDDDWRLIADDLRPTAREYAYLDRDVEPGHSYTYRLVAQEADGTLRELHRGSVTVPARDLVLEQNIPNPFNPSTTIRFYLPARARVRVEVFDVSGARVARLAEGVYDAGPHRVTWDGTDASGTRVGSGVYLYRLQAGARTLTRKMIVVK